VLHDTFSRASSKTQPILIHQSDMTHHTTHSQCYMTHMAWTNTNESRMSLYYITNGPCHTVILVCVYYEWGMSHCDRVVLTVWMSHVTLWQRSLRKMNGTCHIMTHSQGPLVRHDNVTQCETWLIVRHDPLWDMTRCETWLIVRHGSFTRASCETQPIHIHHTHLS